VVDELGLNRGVDRGLVLVAGEVGLVDQASQRVGDLVGPVGVGVGLARALMRASGLAIRQTRARPLAGEHCVALDRESC
jgi:hypothetical protein